MNARIPVHSLRGAKAENTKKRGIEYNRVAKDARSEPCIECLLRGVPNRFRLAKKTITMRDFSQAIARGSV